MDQYYECLVKRKVNMGVSLLSMVFALLAFFLLAAAFVITPFTLPLAAIMGVLAWLIFCRSRVEYEYLVMEGEISVDVIYNRSKRKHLGDYDLKSVCLFVPEDAGQLYNYRGNTVRNFSTCRSQEKHYVMVSRDGGATVLVKLTPDERMLSLVGQLLPAGAFVR